MKLKVSSYRALSPIERAEFHAAIWRLTIIRLSLATGIERTQRRFGSIIEPHAHAPNLDLIKFWRRRSTAIRRASVLVPGSHCLARSLTLRWWMRQRGLAAHLVIGVRKGPAGLETHSWVEFAENVMDDCRSNIVTFRVIRDEASEQAVKT